MKKVLMCILFALLGIGAVVCAAFMAANQVADFWIYVVAVVAACLLISPYKPIFMFGTCLTLLVLGLVVAGGCWFGFDGTTGLWLILPCLYLAGSGLICMALPFAIGALMELVCGREAMESATSSTGTIFAILGSVVLALLAYFVVYPFMAYQAGNYDVYLNMYSVEEFEIPSGTTQINSDQFANFDDLKYVTIPDTVTYICESAFYHCYNLQEIIIPDSVTGLGRNAFRECGNLERVVLSNNITRIERFTFYKCEALKEITIPAGIEYISDEAFSYCYNVEDIYFGGTKEQWDGLTKYSKWESPFGDYTVHCTDGDFEY